MRNHCLTTSPDLQNIASYRSTTTRCINAELQILLKRLENVAETLKAFDKGLKKKETRRVLPL